MQTTDVRVENAVNAMESLVNCFGLPQEEFNQIASRMHRTNQQSFTKLVLGWLEFVASPEYRTDGRNQASQDTCRKLLKLWEDDQVKQGVDKTPYNDCMFKPSQWLHMV